MTRRQLIELIGDEVSVKKAINESIPEMPSLLDIKKKDEIEVDLTLDEIHLICSKIELTEIQMILIDENYTCGSKRFIDNRSSYVEGTEKFLHGWKLNPAQHKCCAACIFAQGRTLRGRGVRLHPYCTFHNRYIETVTIIKYHKEKKMNFLLDGCPSFIKAENPLLLYKD